jgi:4-hydroxy-tetrahydrodipicolinate reductase
MSSTRVGVLGAAGRMGNAVCQAVEGDASLELVARVDPAGGEDVSTSLYGLVEMKTEVAVDFTQPATVMDNVRFCVGKGIHCVVGTTGLGDDDLEEIRGLVDEGSANVFVAPNFSIGAVLMMAFARQAARHFGSAEVIELHHNRKLDAPSGTALRTARGIAEAWKEHGRPDGGEAHPDEKETVSGARGANADGVHVHAVRLHGLVAHQEAVFGGPGETVSIRHDSLDRASFMPGVLLAVKSVASRPGLTVGLEELLDFG